MATISEDPQIRQFQVDFTTCLMQHAYCSKESDPDALFDTFIAKVEKDVDSLLANLVRIGRGSLLELIELMVAKRAIPVEEWAGDFEETGLLHEDILGRFAQGLDAPITTAI